MTMKLTPAQIKFIQKFDTYTRRGTVPMSYREVCPEWRVQFRTANTLVRQGILKEHGKKGLYIVNPSIRDDLGLRSRVFITKVLRPRKRLAAFCSF